MTTLISTIHDPQGKMTKIAREQIEGLRRIYDKIILIITNQTSIEIAKVLEPYASIYFSCPAGISQGRRDVLSLALSSSDSSHFHYCDFDRVLHWYLFYSSELATAVRFLQGYDFTIFERTERAFSTHPSWQRETEAEANLIFSKWFGQEVDILSGSRGLCRRIALSILLAPSQSTHAGTDAEWPMVARIHNASIGFFKAEGLEYETDTFEARKEGQLEKVTRIQNLDSIKGAMNSVQQTYRIYV